MRCVLLSLGLLLCLPATARAADPIQGDAASALTLVGSHLVGPSTHLVVGTDRVRGRLAGNSLELTLRTGADGVRVSGTIGAVAADLLVVSDGKTARVTGRIGEEGVWLALSERELTGRVGGRGWAATSADGKSYRGTPQTSRLSERAHVVIPAALGRLLEPRARGALVAVLLGAPPAAPAPTLARQ